MAQLVMKLVIDVDEYEQLKLAASKLAESETIIKENLKIKHEQNSLTEAPNLSNLEQTEQVFRTKFEYL